MLAIARHVRWVLLVVLSITTIFIWQAVTAEERNGLLTVTFLDVGQGDAIFIEAPSGNQMLIDGGRGQAVLRELGAVLPMHDRSIDIVVATHPDQDHIGGLLSVLERYDVSYIFRSGVVRDTQVYQSFTEAVEREGAQVDMARRGTRIDLGGGAYFDVLYPDRDVSGLDPNDASIIGRLVYGDVEVMLTGDAPQWVEQHLVSLDAHALESDILKAGHHGSKTSSAAQFVGFVDPEYAVISAGCENRYGHPHQEVLDVLMRFDSEIISTCEEGRMVFETDGSVLWHK